MRREMTPERDAEGSPGPHARGFAALGMAWILGGAALLAATPVAAQELTLVVRVIDAETRQPVTSATVEHRAADSTVLAAATTDPRGIASLRVGTAPPYELAVRRIGYVGAEHVVDEVGAAPDGRWLVQIELERAPIELDGITAEGRAWEGHFGPWVFRPDGMYYERAMDFCLYLIVDEVLITDPREMLRTMRRYYVPVPPGPGGRQATVRSHGVRVTETRMQNSSLPEQYREPAWPCGARVLWTAENYSHRDPPW